MYGVEVFIHDCWYVVARGVSWETAATIKRNWIMAEQKAARIVKVD